MREASSPCYIAPHGNRGLWLISERGWANGFSGYIERRVDQAEARGLVRFSEFLGARRLNCTVLELLTLREQVREQADSL